jgi:hypothetical protein
MGVIGRTLRVTKSVDIPKPHNCRGNQPMGINDLPPCRGRWAASTKSATNPLPFVPRGGGNESHFGHTLGCLTAVTSVLIDGSWRVSAQIEENGEFYNSI